MRSGYTGENKWEEITSDKLLPGDLVSVGRTKEDSGVACDMLLVEGNCDCQRGYAVWRKHTTAEGLGPITTQQMLRSSRKDWTRTAFLYGGTKVLQVTHGTASDDTTSKLPLASQPPPDNGAMAIVVKTGFETARVAWSAQ